MSPIKDIVLLARKRRLLIAGFFLVNIIIVGFILIPQFKSVHEASVKIAFNSPNYDLENTRAEDYLFKTGSRFDHSEYLSDLQSDTLMRLAVSKFDLVSHYGIDPQSPHAIKTAAERLRARVEFITSFPVLTLKHKDDEGKVAEEVLVFLVNEVRKLKVHRVAQNHEVTRRIASTELASLNGDLSTLEEKITAAHVKHLMLNPVEKQQLNLWEGQFATKTNRKFVLEEQIAQIERASQMARFEPYTVINQGARNSSKNKLVLLLLGAFSLLMMQFLEMQIVIIVDQALQTTKQGTLIVAETRERDIRTGS